MTSLRANQLWFQSRSGKTMKWKELWDNQWCNKNKHIYLIPKNSATAPSRAQQTADNQERTARHAQSNKTAGLSKRWQVASLRRDISRTQRRNLSFLIAGKKKKNTPLSPFAVFLVLTSKEANTRRKINNLILETNLLYSWEVDKSEGI